MSNKLNCILLIDDDEATNFVHRMVIKKAGCAEEVVAVPSGQAALEYLTSEKNGQMPKPDLIFLDINMPAMNGWEFLKEYEKLEEAQKGQVVVVMLTTSLNPDDRRNAESIEAISSFENKPLTFEILQTIVDQYFAGSKNHHEHSSEKLE